MLRSAGFHGHQAAEFVDDEQQVSSHAHGSGFVGGDDDSGALEALWRFEASYHIFLSNELATHHGAFVHDLYDAMDTARRLQEQQSVRVLAVLHDKDVRIQELEHELRIQGQHHQSSATLVDAPPSKNQSTQCDFQADERDELRNRIREQDEQIEVLLDELERLQALLVEAHQKANEKTIHTAAAPEMRGDPRKLDVVGSVDASTQTTGEPMAAVVGGEQTVAAIAALQKQLENVEKSNATQLLHVKNRSRATEESYEELDALAKQLSDAIRVMEMSTQCCISPLSVQIGKIPCMDLEHKLQTQEMERNQLMAEVCSLRQALCGSSRPQYELVSLPRPSQSSTQSNHSQCSSITCQHTLQRILALARLYKRQEADGKPAKTLRDELRRALRGRSDDEASSLVARIAAQWMGWETLHIHEINDMRQSLNEALEVRAARSAHLVDEVYRLSQRNIELQVELKAAQRPLAKYNDNNNNSKTFNEETQPPPLPEPTNRRLLILEQSLLVKQEQLDVANRTIHALSSGPFSERAISSDSDSYDSKAVTTLAPKSKSPSPATFPLDGTRMLAQMTAELQLVREQQFTGVLQPKDMAAHAVVEYFRLEKECLRLTHQLRAKNEQLEQLQLHCQQLEQSCSSVRTSHTARNVFHAIQELAATEPLCRNGDSDEKVEPPASADRFYARYLERRNADLSMEMATARTHIVHLERQQRRERNHDDGTSVLQRLVAHLQEHHTQAKVAFHAWQARSRESSHDNEVQGSDIVLASYGILLTHYEDLCLQLGLLQGMLTTTTALLSSSHRHERFDDLPGRWRLIQQIHVLEDRLLQAHSCLHCGAHVHSMMAPTVNKFDQSTSTEWIANGNLAVATQTTRRNAHLSRGIQVSIAPFQSETTPQLQGVVPNQDSDLSLSTCAVEGKKKLDHEREMELQAIHRQLGESFARITELTTQKDKLTQKLEDAKKTNRKHVKEQEKLLSKISDMSTTNAELSSRLSQQEKGKTAAPGAVVPAKQDKANEENHEGAAATTMETMAKQQTVRQQETTELVRQLCDAKERCCQAERTRDEAMRRCHELEDAVRLERSQSDQDQQTKLEAYMGKVNESLASIERDKQRLHHENQELVSKLRQLEVELAKKDMRDTRSCGTEIDSKFDVDRLRALPDHQSLQARAATLLIDLDMERQRREAAENDKEEVARSVDTQRNVLHIEKTNLESLVLDIQQSYAALQQEFAEYEIARGESKEEADARIVFLAKCVDECSRLLNQSSDVVDANRSVYDTIMVLAKRVAASVVSGGSSGASAAKKRQHTIPAVVVSAAAPPRKNGKEEPGHQLNAELQAEMWKVRIAKLEASLRAAVLKNKTLEDMVDHLELQMDGLKDDVKDRMTKESMMAAKHGHLRLEMANLKTQSTTLTSRLAECCTELKRCQDASKASEIEVARLRSALQRKTELLASQKQKAERTQKALETSGKRIAQLEATERVLASTQVKQKEQHSQLQELKQQCVVYRDTSVELSDHVEKHKHHATELHVRVKKLKLENGLLRDQLKDWKKENHHKDGSGDAPQGTSAPPATAAMSGESVLTAQVKSLKRRILQKQEVILAYKTKVAQMDHELTVQRTEMFNLSNANRQLAHVQREKEQSLMQGVAQMKNEMETAVSSKSQELDGLRASLFDACEVFVQCDRLSGSPPPPARAPVDSSPSSSSPSSSSVTWPDDEYPDDHGHHTRRGTTDELLMELRRYADLSPSDLDDLHITTSKHNANGSRRHGGRHRSDKSQVALVTKQRLQKQGQQVLHDLEQALEITPHDCRTEICQVLEFLCSKPSRSAPARGF